MRRAAGENRLVFCPWKGFYDALKIQQKHPEKNEKATEIALKAAVFSRFQAFYQPKNSLKIYGKFTKKTPVDDAQTRENQAENEQKTPLKMQKINQKLPFSRGVKYQNFSVNSTKNRCVIYALCI